jgi:uncharacterized protein (DUF433 family)
MRIADVLDFYVAMCDVFQRPKSRKTAMLQATHSHSLRHIEPLDPRLIEHDRIQPGNSLFGLVWINPKRVSGAPCFYGTRVPVKNLFDSLAAGESLEEFLDGFEGVSREQVLAVLDLAGDDLLNDLERL